MCGDLCRSQPPRNLGLNTRDDVLFRSELSQYSRASSPEGVVQLEHARRVCTVVSSETRYFKLQIVELVTNNNVLTQLTFHDISNTF